MMIDLLKENSELLHKVGIKKYMNDETNQLEIDLSDFKIFNENKKIDTFYLYGVIYNKKTNKYIEENGKFRFKFTNTYLNDSINILKINNTKLIFKTINKFIKLYNNLDYEIHFLLIPLDDKFFNVITECEKNFDTFLLEELINLTKIQTSAESLLRTLINSFKFLYYLVPFIVIIILQSSISYYIINSGGFSWEIINSSFIINTSVYFFIYFVSQLSSELGILYILYIFCTCLVFLFAVASQLSVITYFVFLLRKISKWISNIVACNQNKKSYLIEDINISVYKIHKNNTFKTFPSFFLSTFVLPILILSIITIIIIIKDIININKQNINEIDKSFNIIYAISKEYISKTSFPALIKIKTGQIAILMNSNEYESEIYTIDEIKSVINKSKNNCDFANIFDKYFFKNNSDSKNFKDFYLAFLFGNMENLSNSKIRNNDYDYLPRQSQEYLETMGLFEELLSK
ncbi:hypothetical protein ACOL3A_09575 [Aliarcobacter butzleri]